VGFSLRLDIDGEISASNLYKNKLVCASNTNEWLEGEPAFTGEWWQTTNLTSQSSKYTIL
jgi:hypothetical protein